MKKAGRLLRAWRGSRSQAATAEAIGIQRPSYTRVEQGGCQLGLVFALRLVVLHGRGWSDIVELVALYSDVE